MSALYKKQKSNKNDYCPADRRSVGNIQCTMPLFQEDINIYPINELGVQTYNVHIIDKCFNTCPC